MDSDIHVRKVTQDILMFVWFKHRIILEEPSSELRFIPEITSQLMNNLCNAIWIQSFLCDCMWRGFFRKHLKRMTSSSELFTTYVSHACYTLNESTRDACAGFFDTLSLVTYFVLRCWEAGSKEFLNTCVDFFCAFFEKEFSATFEDEGGWENFNDYIEEQIISRHCTHFINANIRSFQHFDQREDKLVAAIELSFVSCFMYLQEFTETDVETDYRAVSFAQSVAGRMRELCQKTFDELLIDFAKMDSQVEELYRQTVGEASGGLTREHLSTRKIQKVAENLPSETNSVKKELVKQIATTSDISDTRNSNIDIPKVDVPNKASSYFNPETEKARKLLGDITMDISKLSLFIQSLYEERGVQARIDNKV